MRTADIGPDVRLIAFYLPQFHRIPENDAWWEEGFTEWTLVRRARSLYAGHEQPRIPSPTIGYYDATAPGVLTSQAALAAAHGISGFAFYHYWFCGRRLLERPVDDWIRSGPAFPFCLVWANDPWTRAWDGKSDVVLQPQAYGDHDTWRRHFHDLLPAFADPRAIRIAERPVFLIYRPGHNPHLSLMLDAWRQEAERVGIPAPYVVAMLSGFEDLGPSSEVIDATCEFAPFAARSFRSTRPARQHGFVDDYERAWNDLLRVPDLHPVQFRGAFVGFDNTPRRGRDGVVYADASPALYQRYLETQIRRAAESPPGYRFVFVNAWNEWSEGCYLEPDIAHGEAYLAATRAAVSTAALRKVKDDCSGDEP